MRDITRETILELLQPRPQESHKGTFGSVLTVAGSAQYRGAAALAVEGALRTGAGIVTLASVESVFSSVLTRLPECCLMPCGADEAGGIQTDEARRLIEKSSKSKVLLFGPGLGNTASTQKLLEEVIQQISIPVVLDADGLNAAAAILEKKKALPHPAGNAPLILTPHPGEMARLSGLTTAQVNAEREKVARDFASRHKCVLVLKGNQTLIASPEGALYRNTTGNAGLARGGSGDILAGMIAGVLSCNHLKPELAAACAVWLHGAAADETAKRLGQTGMLPHDIFGDLGALFAGFGL